jgi:hypothetical protein
MGIRRPGTKGYEEVDGVISTTPANKNAGGGIGGINSTLAAPEFELASVSVVPDGKLDRFYEKTYQIFESIFKISSKTNRHPNF